MATVVPPLRHGDRLSRAEFERRWDAAPDRKFAELLDGVVNLHRPGTVTYGGARADLVGWLGLYHFHTPGTQGLCRASLRLDDANMTQPVAILRPTHSGTSCVDPDGILSGPPELVAEVPPSENRRVKKALYRAKGVQEYLVWRVDDGAVDWFVLRPTGYEPLPVGADSVVRSEVFPGLWLDPAALVAGDGPALLRAAQLGHGSPEHAAFVRRLAGNG